MASEKTKLRPLGDYIVVEPLLETELASGFIIPETVSKEKPQRGKVMAIGQGKLDNEGKRIPMEVKEGDVVLFTKYAPTEVKIDDQELLVLNQSDVLAIID